MAGGSRWEPLTLEDTGARPHLRCSYKSVRKAEGSGENNRKRWLGRGASILSEENTRVAPHARVPAQEFRTLRAAQPGPGAGAVQQRVVVIAEKFRGKTRQQSGTAAVTPKCGLSVRVHTCTHTVRPPRTLRSLPTCIAVEALLASSVFPQPPRGPQCPSEVAACSVLGGR